MDIDHRRKRRFQHGRKTVGEISQRYRSLIATHRYGYVSGAKYRTIAPVPEPKCESSAAYKRHYHDRRGKPAGNMQITAFHNCISFIIRAVCANSAGYKVF